MWKTVIHLKVQIFQAKLGGITGLSWSVELVWLRLHKYSEKKRKLQHFFNSSLFGGLVLIPVNSSYLFKTISY